MHKYFQGDEARIPWATDPFREKLPSTEAWISINSIEDSSVSNLVLTVTQWFRTFSSLTWRLFQTFMCPVVKHIPKSTFSNSDPLFSHFFLNFFPVIPFAWHRASSPNHKHFTVLSSIVYTK